jgi:hypothetical protein
MENNLKILYNDIDVFRNIAPTPFFTFSEEFVDFNTKWNQVTTINLAGQLTGKYLGPLSYSSLNDSVTKLFSGFSGNYGSLKINDGATNIFTADKVVINSINIDESLWYGILPFNIDITFYDSGLFSDYYGIVEPQETVSFDEEDGDIINLTHSISAKGIATVSNNAIENAKNWVKSKTGNYNIVSPILISDNPQKNYILVSSKETIDRFNGTYSWDGDYRKNVNPESPSNSFLNYTVDLSSGYDDGFINASIDGTLNGNNITNLRTSYNNLNLYNICNNAAIDTFKTILSSRTISQNVNESPNENSLSFNSSFNNDYSSDIINSYTVDINQDVLKCITNVSFKTDITAKYGDISTRWTKVKAFYDSQFQPYSLANAEYVKEVTNNPNLKSVPLSESLTFDEYNAKISYSATYTDKQVSYSNDILSLNSSVTYSPSVNIYSIHPSAFKARDHNVQDLTCANRSSVTISVTAIAKINKAISVAQSAAQIEINRIRANFVQGSNQLLEDSNISKNNDIKTVTIKETWTFEGDIYS